MASQKIIKALDELKGKFFTSYDTCEKTYDCFEVIDIDHENYKLMTQYVITEGDTSLLKNGYYFREMNIHSCMLFDAMEDSIEHCKKVVDRRILKKETTIDENRFNLKEALSGFQL